jgi:Outer membrane protein beta-barrel domain
MAFLNPRFVAVQLDTLRRQDVSTPSLVADTVHPLPLPVTSRWSVALGLGLDLTHRHLAGAGAAPLQRIERATGAGQAAVSVGFLLKPQWRLSAGIGYTAYREALRARLSRTGTTLAYVENQIVGPDGQPIRTLSWQWVPTDSLLGRRTVRATPAAHYLTLPLFVEWLPKLTAPRWRPVVAGGVTPHVLLNARQATLTGQCDCETTPAALQRFALGLAASVGIEYALRPDWWLTVRPSGTYLLTNTAAPGQPARHPWRLGLSVGLRWNPAPRPATH